MAFRDRATFRLDDSSADDDPEGPSTGDTASGTATAATDNTAKFVAPGARVFVERDIRGHPGHRPGDKRPHASLADVAKLASKTGKILRERPPSPVLAIADTGDDLRIANPPNFRGGAAETAWSPLRTSTSPAATTGGASHLSVPVWLSLPWVQPDWHGSSSRLKLRRHGADRHHDHGDTEVRSGGTVDLTERDRSLRGRRTRPRRSPLVESLEEDYDERGEVLGAAV